MLTSVAVNNLVNLLRKYQKICKVGNVIINLVINAFRQYESLKSALNIWNKTYRLVINCSTSDPQINTNIFTKVNVSGGFFP